MTIMVRTAVLLMTAALAFYSVGVWSERLSGRLNPWHLSLFWLGFVCDTVGTDLVWRLAGGFRPTFHGATGGLALILMLLHASWATGVLIRRDERATMTFHRISVVVWALWLVPFVTGMLLG